MRLIFLGVCATSLLVGAGGCSSTSSSTVSTPKHGYSYKGRLRFFASGKTAPPIKQRIYGTSFPVSTTRYVHSEIELTNHEYGRSDQWVHIERKYYRPNGTVLRVVSGRDRIPKTWRVSNSNGGVGYPASGKWKPGRYRVVVSLDGRRVASGTFRIYGTPTATRKRYVPPKRPSRGYAFKSLKLFESGWSQPSSPTYRTSFASAGTRFINWSVTLTNKRRYLGDQALNFRAVYYRGATQVGTSTYKTSMKSGWASRVFSRGYGSKAGNSWKPGGHKVVLSVNGNYLATRYFTVTGTTYAKTPPVRRDSGATKINVFFHRATVGSDYRVKPSYTGSFVKYPQWKIVKRWLPPGLRIDPSSGRISGIPKQVGTWTFTLGLRDRYKGTSKQPAGKIWYYQKDCTLRVAPKAKARPKAAFPAPTRLGRTRYAGSEWTLINDTASTLTLRYSGARSGTVTLAPKARRTLRIPNGRYTVSGSSSDPTVRPYSGSVSLARGYRYSNRFYIRTTPRPTARPIPRPTRRPTPIPKYTPRPRPTPSQSDGERSTEGS